MKRRFVQQTLPLLLAGGLWLGSGCDKHADPAKQATPEKAHEKEGTHVERNEAGETVVALPKETQARIGLKLGALKAVSLGPEIKAYGRVVDPAPLAVLASDLMTARLTASVSQQEVERVKATRNAELAAAETALKVSREELIRLTKLHEQGNASTRALQTAEAALKRDELLMVSQHAATARALQTAEANAQRDQLQAAAVRGRLLLATGKSVVERDDLTDFIQTLVNGAAALLRLDVPAGQALPGGVTGARILATKVGAAPTDAEYLGATANVDALTQGTGFLFFVNGASDLAPGSALTGWLKFAGGPIEGVVIPRDAVVRFNGLGWAYVKTSKDDFTRREVGLNHPVADGWFVTSGFSAKDEVVMVGAQQLLSEESKGKD